MPDQLIHSRNNDLVCILVANNMDSEKSAEFFDMAFNLNIHPPFNINNAMDAVAKNKANLPTVLLGITVDAGSLFLPEFFDKIFALKYPKSKMDVHVSCQSPDHLPFVENLMQEWRDKKVFRSVNLEKEFKGEMIIQSNYHPLAFLTTKNLFGRGQQSAVLSSLASIPSCPKF